MKRFVRCGVIALIALGLASQIMRAHRGGAVGDPTAVLGERLERLDIRWTRSSNTNVLVNHSPLCEQPFFAASLSLDGSDDADVRELVESDYVVKYVYEGVASEQPSKPGLIGHWAWDMALFDLGLRRGAPSRRVVVVAWPRSCERLASIDWSVLSE